MHLRRTFLDYFMQGKIAGWQLRWTANALGSKCTGRAANALGGQQMHWAGGKCAGLVVNMWNVPFIQVKKSLLSLADSINKKSVSELMGYPVQTVTKLNIYLTP